MLVLTRKPGEKIVLSFHGEDVVVEVLAGGRCRVSVGVTASPSVKILRHELWEKLDDGQQNHRVAMPAAAG